MIRWGIFSLSGIGEKTVVWTGDDIMTHEVVPINLGLFCCLGGGGESDIAYRYATSSVDVMRGRGWLSGGWWLVASNCFVLALAVLV